MYNSVKSLVFTLSSEPMARFTTKQAQINHLEELKKWLDFGELDLIFIGPQGSYKYEVGG